MPDVSGFGGAEKLKDVGMGGSAELGAVGKGGTGDGAGGGMFVLCSSFTSSYCESERASVHERPHTPHTHTHKHQKGEPFLLIP